MSLQLRARKRNINNWILTVMSVFAFVVAPFYAVVANHVANAIGGTTVNYDFNTYAGGTTWGSNWVFSSGVGYYSTSTCGQAPNCVSFNANNETATLTLPSETGQVPSNLAFWARAEGGTPAFNSNLQIKVDDAAGKQVDYQTYGATGYRVTPISASGSSLNFNLPASAHTVVFNYEKGSGNLAFDDVAVSYAQGSVTPAAPTISTPDAYFRPYRSTDHPDIHWYYGVDFNVSGYNNISALTVQLLKNGVGVAENQATSQLIAGWNTTPTLSTSSPFYLPINTPNTSSWTHDAAQFTTATQPDEVIVTVTDDSGTHSNSAAITSDSYNGTSYTDVVPAPISHSTVVVTPSNTEGWGAQDGAPTFVSGPAGATGSGSLKLTTGASSSDKQDYFHGTNTLLKDISELGYKLDAESGIPASYQLQVTGVDRLDSTTSTFTSLVWEPAYNGQPNGPNGGFVTEPDIEQGTWWSSHPIAGDPNGQNGFVSLSDIIAANPGAVVTAFGVGVGSGTPNATSYVDDLDFNGTTYNFEPTPVVAPQAPTNLQVKYQYDTNYVASGSVIRTLAKPGNNNLELTWDNGGDTSITGYHILVTLPDGSHLTKYQGSNANSWLAGHNGDEFGLHGEGLYTFQVEAVNANGTATSTETFKLYYASNIPTATFETTPARYVNGNFQVTIVGQDTTVLDTVGADVRDLSNPTAPDSWVTGCSNPTLLNGATLPAYSDNGSGVTVKVTCTIDTSNMVDGHSYMLRAGAGYTEADGSSYGNVNSDGNFTFTYDTTKPSVTFVNPSKFYNPSTAKFNLTATDMTSGVSNWQVKFFDENGHDLGIGSVPCIPQVLGANASATCYPSSTSLNFNKFVDGGTYTAVAYATDKAGNVGTASLTFTVDDTAPTVTITTPSNGSSVTTTKDLLLSGTATDSLSGVSFVWLKLRNPTTGAYDNIRDETTGIHTDAAGNWTYNLTVADLAGYVASDGTLTVEAEAVDNAGNPSTLQYYTYNVNNLPPLLIVNPSSGTDLTPTLTGATSDASDLVTITLGGQNYTATVNTQPNAAGTYDWSYTFTTPLGVGTYPITVTDQSLAGLVTSQTSTVTVTSVLAPQQQHQAFGALVTPASPNPTGTIAVAVTPQTPAATNGQAVLGASDKKSPSSSDDPASGQAVKGAEKTVAAINKGIAWYYWVIILILAALALLWWIIAAARRRREQQNA